MRRFSTFLKIIIAATMMTFVTACTKVPAGNVGVLFNLYGSDKGVDTKVVGPGRYWLTINEELYLFPTFTQNYVWTQEDQPDQGSPGDESISFQSIEGLSINADIGISYAIDPNKVSDVFQKYRKGVDEITDVYLRNMVRDALVTHASVLGAENIYGAGRTSLIAQVQDTVRKQVEPIGIKVEKIYWIGSLRLDPALQKAINSKIEATQIAQRRQNEVETSKAEAQKEVERANGEAQSKLLVAEAEAKAVRIKAEALRANPELVELIKAEAQKDAVAKWDGTLPQQMIPGGAVPFINVGTGK